jgi:RNA-directed DNA polymerase
MNTPLSLAHALALAFAAGTLDEQSLVERGGRLLGHRPRWLRPLARRVAGAFAETARPRASMVRELILAEERFWRAWAAGSVHLVQRLAQPGTICPVDAAREWALPALHRVDELAGWLELTLGELDWFADRKGINGKQHRPRLSHYRPRVLAKRFGQLRLIESPKPRLKAIQRRILADLLDHIPPHEAAHGFRPGRSIKSFAQPHVGRAIVVKIDLRDFFPSISSAWIAAMFRAVGYPEAIADLLAGLCTTLSPEHVWEQVPGSSSASPVERVRRLYARPHLPQGAPTSPALANLAAYRMDCRLAGLAAAAGASYTRYADDLAFSGGEDFQRVANRFHLHACAIAMEEGFAVHHRKTRIMRQGVCQRLAGLVVNRQLNVPRKDFDRLKATLTNCLRHGPTSQNHSMAADFRAHLAGRISFVEMVSPGRGQRLRELFEQIQW